MQMAHFSVINDVLYIMYENNIIHTQMYGPEENEARLIRFIEGMIVGAPCELQFVTKNSNKFMSFHTNMLKVCIADYNGEGHLGATVCFPVLDKTSLIKSLAMLKELCAIKYGSNKIE